MKKLLIGAVLLLALGGILATAGWAMGGETSMVMDIAGHKINFGIHGIFSYNENSPFTQEPIWRILN